MPYYVNGLVVGGYLVAIVVLIARPFIAPVNSDTDERKVSVYGNLLHILHLEGTVKLTFSQTAIFSLTFGAFMFLAFTWSSWFIYQASRSFKVISPRARLLPK